MQTLFKVPESMLSAGKASAPHSAHARLTRRALLAAASAGVIVTVSLQTWWIAQSGMPRVDFGIAAAFGSLLAPCVVAAIVWRAFVPQRGLAVVAVLAVVLAALSYRRVRVAATAQHRASGTYALERATTGGTVRVVFDLRHGAFQSTVSVPGMPPSITHGTYLLNADSVLFIYRNQSGSHLDKAVVDGDSLILTGPPRISVPRATRTPPRGT